MPLDPDDPNVIVAVFGERARNLLGSDIFEYVTKRAAQEIDESLDKLENVDAHDISAVQALQMQIKVVKLGLKWLDDAVIAGDQAMKVIEGE